MLAAAVSVGVLIALHQLDSIYLLYYLVGLVMLYRFRDNIKRLLEGNERRIGETV
jgi:glycerol-3-phosphate acyltransferase PlsY